MKLFLFTVIFFISAAGFAFGQCGLKTNELDRLNCENTEKLEEIYRQMQASKQPFIPKFDDLLPEKNGSWLVSIVYNGGWAGITKILAIVKSDGNFLCREENLVTNHAVPQDAFAEFSGLITDTNFQNIPVLEMKSLLGCYQCSATTLVFAQREEIQKKKKLKVRVSSFNYDIDNFTSENSAIRRIFNKTLDIAACRESQ